MTALKELSKYYNEDTGRTAVIRQEIGTKKFIVTLTLDSGSSFSTTFADVDSAENFAEDWVLNL